MRTHCRRLRAWIFAVLAIQAAVAFADGSARALLEESRLDPDTRAAAKRLEEGYPRAGELSPYYLVEISRLHGVSGDWAASLSWSSKKIEVPETLADAKAWWHGQALERLSRNAEALTVYESRLSKGVSKDIELYRSYFRVSPKGAGNMVALLRKNATLDYQTAYLAGLCAVRSGEWETAEALFTQYLAEASKVSASKASPERPWALFYRGWSLYRQARWKDAVTGLQAYITEYPGHDRAWQAAGAAALASIQNGTGALSFAERAVALAPGPAEKAESLLLKASVQSDANDLAGAAATLRGIADGSLTSGETALSPRALFMLGDVQFRAQEWKRAAETWSSVRERYPADPLAEEAAFRTAEQWFILGEWAQSALAFASYRQSWQNGRFIQSVLSSGAEAYYRSGKPDLAILWWEEFLKRYPASPSSPKAWALLVRAYADAKDYSRALSAAKRYRAGHPADAALDGMDDEITRLTRLQKGENSAAATLATEYSRSGGADTSEGRSKGLALAREYLSDYGNAAQGEELLGEIAGKYSSTRGDYSRQDRVTFATAHALLAERRRDAGDYARASSYYLVAGTLFSPIDGERAAESLYGAVDSFAQIGKRKDAERTAETLRNAFPQSVWASRARLLLSSQ